MPCTPTEDSTLKNFDFFEPTTIEEASSLIARNNDGAAILAGGTDLLIGLKEHIKTPKSVISLARIPGLDGIAYDENTGLLIGGMTKMRSIEQSSIIRNRYTALAEGASEVGSIQIRNLATLGGNICNASPAADAVAALLVFGAQVEIAGTDGKRTIPIQDFFLGPGESTLKRGEIVTGITCPPRPAYSGSHYIKQKIREVMDLAFIGVAASLQLTSGVVKDIKIGLAAVAPTPIRATDAEDILKGNRLTEAILDEAASAASAQSSPISDLRCSADYREDMVRVLTKRTIQTSAARV
jgi:carbon-monoxide dehydrogenase medium subunit